MKKITKTFLKRRLRRRFLQRCAGKIVMCREQSCPRSSFIRVWDESIENTDETYENEAFRQQMAENQQLDQVYRAGPQRLALYRAPALFVTLILELLGGLIIAQLNEVIKKYTLLVSFMPIISALSGNLGLQATSNTTRGLGTGHIRSVGVCTNIIKEIKSGTISASMIASTIAIVGFAWCFLDTNEQKFIEKYPFHPYIFGGVLFCGAWISMMISSVNGAITPVIADKCGIDPAKVSGPLETALQDIIGQSFLLGVSLLVFEYAEPFFF